MKLTDRLWLAGSGSLGVGITHPSDCNIYLMDAGTEIVMIDAGVGIDPESVLRQITRDGLDPGRIKTLLLTHHHSDHAGGAAYWRRSLGVNVYAPAGEADSIEGGDAAALGLDVAKRAGYYPEEYGFTPCTVDERVLPGRRLTIGTLDIEVLNGAGHSIGGVCYRCSLDGKSALFVGDLLAFGGRISLQNIPGVSVSEYARSVLALEDVPVDLFLPGHGLFSLSGGDAHVRAASEAFRRLGVPPNAV